VTDSAVSASRDLHVGDEGFWPHGLVTPARADDPTRFKLTLRDALALLAGCLAMYGAQMAAQYGLRSDIRDALTRFESYQQQQSGTNAVLQRQIDEWRGETKLNRVDVTNLATEISELKGIMMGAGIKGVSSVKR
jgi:hypothetical protein